MGDITEIKRALDGRAQDVAEYLLPNGVLDGRYWCAGSVQGEPGQSLKVCVRGGKLGTWADYAAAGERGDLIDLWCQVKHLPLVAGLDAMRDWLGMAPYHFDKREKSYRRRTSRSAPRRSLPCSNTSRVRASCLPTCCAPTR